MSTELTTIENSGAVVGYSTPDILASFAKIRPSNVSINQLTTRKEGAIPGKLSFSDNSDQVDSITIVPLDLVKQRVMFPPGNDFTQKPTCRSNDGIVPSPFVENPPSSVCSTCPKSKWVKGDGGKNIKPPCAEGILLLAIDKESCLPVYVQFKGSGLVPFRNFLSMLEKDRLKKQAKGLGKPELFDYFFTLKAQRVTEAFGTYYVPIFTDVQQVSEAHQFGPYYEQYVVNKKHTIDEDPEIETADATEAAVESVLNGPAPVAEYATA